MRKIVICGGHLTPALATIEQLQKKGNCQIIFFGRKFPMEGNINLSAEYRIISAKGIKFVAITTGRLQRKFTKYTIWSLFKIPVGFLEAIYNLLVIRPSIVVSFGGYISTPIVVCAWLLGIDSVVHEQAAVGGLANRINSLFAKKIFLTWRQSQKYFSRKSEVIGNPTRSSLTKTRAHDPKIANFLKKSKNLIFVTGGNQGSHFLNSLTFELLPRLVEFSILHQVGTANFKGDLDRAKAISNPNYLCTDYLDNENIGAVYNQAKFVIARAGANTVWDIAMLAKVAILIPLPISASGEQAQNAQILADAGSALVLDQKEATPPRVTRTIEDLLKNFSQHQKSAQKFNKTLPKDSAAIIAKYISEHS